MRRDEEVSTRNDVVKEARFPEGAKADAFQEVDANKATVEVKNFIV
jgi:hypothetical protein